MAMKTLDEPDVGILCYISNLPGFRGILKQRYSDFIVNEVDRDGNVVQLSSLDAPAESAQENGTKTSDTKILSYASQIESFKSLAGEADAQHLKEFIDQINSGGGDSVSHIVLSPDSDKSHRTAMHNFFKENFKFLVSDTVDGPDASSKCILVRLPGGPNSNKGRNSKKRKERYDKPFHTRGSENWPENVGKFLRFNLYKENRDTQEALGLIGNMLGIQPRSFGFAGTKDKRAVSTQRVTVYKQQASRLSSFNEKLIGIKVGDFCYVKEGLLLGQLFGNRFTITLRGIVADSEDTIKASADALGRHGFINYFGLQRFGSGSVATHIIGAALLRGKWKHAVDMILDPREGERDAITKAREYYKKSNDVEGTLKQLPRHLVAERAVLQSLKKSPGNYLQALKAIPRTLRMMYVHSYQSYLWNHAASARVQKYGTEQVVLGDLVYCKENTTGKGTGFAGFDCDVGCSGRYDSNTEVSGVDIQEERNSLVKVVTAEDLNSGCYTIDDVILPMPGSRVFYPTNDVAEVYHVLAKKDGISLTRSVHNVKEFSITSMTGSYRRVFQKPINFEWELLTYNDSSKPLVMTDLDKIGKSKPLSNVKPVDAPNGKKEEVLDCMRQSESCGDGAKVDNDNNEKAGEEVILLLNESICGSSSQSSPITMVETDYNERASEEVILPQDDSICGSSSQDSQIANVETDYNGKAGEEVILLQDESICGSTSQDSHIAKVDTDYNEKAGDKVMLPQDESIHGSSLQDSHVALKLSFTLPASCYATMAIRELLKTSTSVAYHKTLNQ